MVQLRKRTNNVSYAKAYSFGSDEEQGPSTSKKRAYESDGSESAFSGSQVNQPSEEESEPIEDAGEGESSESGPEHEPESGSDLEVGRGAGKKRALNESFGVAQTGPGLQTLLAPQRHVNLSTRQAELLALQHNSRPLHCPQPIYLPSGSTTRLTRQPSLFENISSVGEPKRREDTTDWWSDVVGPGPLWKLVEDKGWSKEGTKTSAAEEVQDQSTSNDTKVPRPGVYGSVLIHPGDVEILTIEEAATYLPNSSLSSPDSQISCYLGPFDNQNLHRLTIFDSIKLSEHFDSNNKAHVFSAGAPIWALDWCPTTDSDHQKQYLAVGPCSSRNFKLPLGTRVYPPCPACIQIWSLHPCEGAESDVPAEDRGAVTCEMVLCVDSGPALCLKWCPLPSNDPEKEEAPSSTQLRKLGILAGVFADGSLQFFAVPYPEDTQKNRTHAAAGSSAGSLPVFVRLNKPLLKIDLEESPIWSFDWANGDMVTVGTTSGTVLVYHVKDHLSSQTTEPLLPSFVKPVHQSGIRSISWVKAPPSDSLGQFLPAEDPTMICSVGYDGEIFITDTRDQSSTSMGRYRDVINTVTFSSWAGGCIIPESDSVKWFNYSPVVFGRGRHIFSTTGPIWDVAVSDFHPFVAAAASDGALRISNMLRVSRKGYNTGPDHLRAGKSQNAPASKGKKKKKKATEQETEGKGSSSSTWPPEIGVLCTSWNPNGLTKCQLLASATASGLCRIDDLWSSAKGDKGAVAGKGKEKDQGEEMEVDEDEE
ncbi:hypothetical protein FRC04_010942 [Tulasnella sp. 424]|nr:hypothetical protein FRC04_010942 [Tulasnella sp. 424]KAG8975696.1 hypothetical protein FRC05_005214 [Tulasnella sp. 425]